MASQKQIEANGRNALRSTGPRTPAGRRVSALNAVKHGLLSREVVLQTEWPEEFEALLTELRVQIAPVGILERVLVDRIAASLWRLRRLNRIQTETLAAQLCRQNSESAQEDLERLQKFDAEGKLYADDEKHAEALREAVNRARDALKQLCGPDFALGSAVARAFGNGCNIESLT